MANDPKVVLGEEKQISMKDIFTQMSKDFIKHEEIVKALFNGYHSGNNVILYGPPGYGKSEMSEAFLQALGYTEDQIGIFSVNMDTAPEELFGNVNMEKLYSDNKFEMNLHNSVFSKEVVIFEELFDGTPAALASLKHVLTKKVYYYNDQRYEIKTKFIIACTNKSTSEFNEDNQDTYRALIERFPIIKQVKWSTHLEDDYKKLLRKKFPKLTGSELKGLGRIFQLSRFEGGHISPRIAITATKSYMVGQDVEDLAFVLPELDKNVINDSRGSFKAVKKEDLTAQIETALMSKIIDKLDPLITTVEENFQEVLKVDDYSQKLSALDAMYGYIHDIETDFQDRLNFTLPVLQEVFNSKVYGRLDALKNQVQAEKDSVFARIDHEKKNILYSIYAKFSAERMKLIADIQNLIEEEG